MLEYKCPSCKKHYVSMPALSGLTKICVACNHQFEIARERPVEKQPIFVESTNTGRETQADTKKVDISEKKPTVDSEEIDMTNDGRNSDGNDLAETKSGGSSESRPGSFWYVVRLCLMIFAMVSPFAGCAIGPFAARWTGDPYAAFALPCLGIVAGAAALIIMYCERSAMRRKYVQTDIADIAKDYNLQHQATPTRGIPTIVLHEFGDDHRAHR